MGKVVTTDFECDANNCGTTGENEADFVEIDLVVSSQSDPERTRGKAYLCRQHADTLADNLRDNFGLVLR